MRQERKVASKSRRIVDYEGVLVGSEEAQAPPCWNAGSLPATLSELPINDRKIGSFTLNGGMKSRRMGEYMRIVLTLC